MALFSGGDGIGGVLLGSHEFRFRAWWGFVCVIYSAPTLTACFFNTIIWGRIFTHSANGPWKKKFEVYFPY